MAHLVLCGPTRSEVLFRFALLQGGERFDKVAQEYSEDKAKGRISSPFSMTRINLSSPLRIRYSWRKLGLDDKRVHGGTGPFVTMTHVEISHLMLVGPLPRSSLRAPAINRRQTRHVLSREDQLRLPHHHGRGPTMMLKSRFLLSFFAFLTGVLSPVAVLSLSSSSQFMPQKN